MKNITKLTLAAFAVLTFCFSGYSQKILKKADAAFEARQYFDAVNLYKEAYSSAPKDKKGIVLYRAGVSSQKINDYKGAEAYYQKAIAADFDDPNVYFHLAEVMKNQEKYPEAIVEFKNFKAKGGDGKKADLGVKSCELAQQWMDNPLRYKVENISLINSKGRDYAPCFSDKKYQTIVITSNRDGSMGTQDMITGSNKSDLWEAKLDKNGKWSTPVLLPPAIATEVNEGRGWVSKRGDMIFFTRCPEEKGLQNTCGLYMAKKQGSTWGPASRLPFSNDTVTFAHPSLTADGKILYFASNRAGGYGKMDIWSSTYDLKSNVWGQPKNLGPTVNTEGNEVYPSVTDDGKKLYFASDYHPGLGGLDMFVTEAGADGKFNKQVENLKSPLNSSFDDFGIVFEGKKNRGYFTSNRDGGRGDDDIWSFSLPMLSFNVKGNVFNEGDPNTTKGKGETVEGVKVKVIGSNGTIDEVTTLKDGGYSFKLKDNTTYTVSTETGKSSKAPSHPKDGFLSNRDVRVITTVGEAASKDFVADFAVKPIVPNPRMPEIRYALNSYELMPESKDSLNYLFNIMSDNPATIVELNSHTDSRGDAVSNMTLSAARAQSCVDYLVKDKGINGKRLVAKGYGKTQLLISDADIKKAATQEEKEALHAKNRRTSFKILSFDFVDPNAPKTPTKTKKADDEDDDE
ncbi:MAG: OmpA family protein [bacterium]|nr:OmpA family protein [bacterium]